MTQTGRLVPRLEAHGPRRICFVQRWWVMEAPIGRRLRVVQHRGREGRAGVNTWPCKGREEWVS